MRPYKRRCLLKDWLSRRYRRDGKEDQRRDGLTIHLYREHPTDTMVQNDTASIIPFIRPCLSSEATLKFHHSPPKKGSQNELFSLKNALWSYCISQAAQKPDLSVWQSSRFQHPTRQYLCPLNSQITQSSTVSLSYRIQRWQYKISNCGLIKIISISETGEGKSSILWQQ